MSWGDSGGHRTKALWGALSVSILSSAHQQLHPEMIPRHVVLEPPWIPHKKSFLEREKHAGWDQGWADITHLTLRSSSVETAFYFPQVLSKQQPISSIRAAQVFLWKTWPSFQDTGSQLWSHPAQDLFTDSCFTVRMNYTRYGNYHILFFFLIIILEIGFESTTALTTYSSPHCRLTIRYEHRNPNTSSQTRPARPTGAEAVTGVSCARGGEKVCGLLILSISCEVWL